MTSNPKSYDDLLRNQAFVRSLARRLTVDPHTANDLAQETFVAALQHPPRSTTSMRSYLSRTLRNLASNHRRTDYR
jgi:DNA-directed RNA polymerase specialized sigma24 family protein